VLVVVIAMEGMLVSVVDIVNMVPVLDGFVPAVGPVLVLGNAMFGVLIFGFGGHGSYS
jgi:hypothetical protein